MTEAALPVLLGVDAGNSKTVAVVADASGAVLGYGRAGNGDIYGAPSEAHAVAEVSAAIEGALRMASGGRVDHGLIAHAAFCLAGMDWESDDRFWCDQLASRFPGMSYSLHNDGFALLRAGEPSGIGVAVSAGTGGAVVARGPVGEWSASFWIVDPMGGTSLGYEAFAAVVRAELGMAPPTALREVLLARHGYPDVNAMLEGATRRGARRLVHAALARDVLDAALAGDEVADAIVLEQGRALASYARAAADKVRLAGSDFSVVLGGSVLSSANPALRYATTTALAELLPDSRITLTPRSPVVGAVAEAIAEGIGPLGTDVVERLTAHQFPPEFLAVTHDMAR
jgi:N-acetylglucosamine kinase-like BadF-type ATPase